MPRPVRSILNLVLFLSLDICAAYAQTPSSGPGQCQVSSGSSQVRAEGLSERLADIFLFCSGYTPGNQIKGSFQVSLLVNVTDRVNDSNMTTQAVLSIDYGSGFTPSGIAGQVTDHTLLFNGVQLLVPPGGNFAIKISDVRAAVNQLGTSTRPVAAVLSTPLLLNQSQLTLGVSTPGLYASFSSSGIVCTGSNLPSTLTMTNLLDAHTAFFSTRVTEGFSSAFVTQAADEDAGTRFVVNYTGFPANAHLYVPDMVAGSTAVVPTAGGDLGVSPSPGLYLPGAARCSWFE